VCPLASFQKATFLDPSRTCSGPTPFLAASYSAASAGYNDCSELRMQAFLLVQKGQPLLRPMPALRTGHKQVWLAFGAVVADPVHHLVASRCDLARIKTCSLVPLTVKFQHCRVLALCQAYCLFQVLFTLEHLGQPLWLSTLPQILACQL